MPEPISSAHSSRGAIRAVLLGAAILLGPLTCHAQLDRQDQPAWYIDAGGGWTSPVGTEGNSFREGWKNFEAAIGFAPCFRRAPDLFINLNFQFDQLTVQKQALLQAQILNPTDIGLLRATNAEAKYDSAMFELTYRRPLKGRVNAYFFGGFGWLRRQLEFTGTANEGALLEPGGPTVFGSSGNSAAVDAGGGIDVRPFDKRFKVFLEFRYLHGLAVNHESMLIPLSAGFRW